MFGGDAYRAVVIEAEAEQTRVWALADRVFPPFAIYRDRAARTGRSIPILQLVPQQP